MSGPELSGPGPAPQGNVNIVASGSLTSTAIVTGGGGTALQTPSATTTVDASGNISTQGSITTGAGGSVAGTLEFTQGTAPSLGTTSVKISAPTSVTSYRFVLPTASATGFLLGTDAANVNTLSFVGFTGTGTVMREGSPTTTGTLTTAAIGASGTITARNASATILNVGTVGTACLLVDSGTFVSISGNGLKWGGTQKLADSATAPTISSGFGASPSIVAHNGTIAFSINVGTGGSASSGVIGLPTATTGWVCHVTDITNNATASTVQSAFTTASVTVTNYSRTTGLAIAWAASDILLVSCRAF